MTLQEIFTKVKAHLLAQDVKSVDGGGGGRCAYRGDGGTKCAVGCLIKDGVYCPELEGHSVTRHPVQAALIASGVLSDTFRQTESSPALRLLRDLQLVHDEHWPDEWPVGLALTARNFDLEDV